MGVGHLHEEEALGLGFGAQQEVLGPTAFRPAPESSDSPMVAGLADAQDGGEFGHIQRVRALSIRALDGRAVAYQHPRNTGFASIERTVPILVKRHATRDRRAPSGWQQNKGKETIH
jgi:hypothetical protein